jgi:AcrR family transcriptional regulator
MARATASRNPRAPAGLSRERIVAAAIALIERDGPEALTMRRLAGELGVEAMSLYNHVANRDELLAAIGDRMLEPLREIPLDAEWPDCARRFAAALRSIGVMHPATFRLVGLQPLDTPISLEGVERLLQALIEQGVSAVDALAIYRAVASYARGYALAETTGFTVDAAHAAGRDRLRALDAGDFPVLNGRAEDLAALDADRGFAHGLDALLAGLAAARR